MSWLKILRAAVKKNGVRQLFFYLSNLDASRFIELTEAIEFLDCGILLSKMKTTSHI